MKKILKKSIYLGVVVLLISSVLSCEEDFTDIGSSVISNTKFDVNSTDIEVVLENSPLEKVQSSNISTQLNQLLLGVYNNSNYEKLEASIVSQILITSGLVVADNTFGADTTVVTKIDTVFLKIPYQVTLEEDSNSNSIYKLDSVFGDPTKPFNLNVYRSNTFMNSLNPLDPTKSNSYSSDDVFEKVGNELNAEFNFPFIPSETDTAIIIKRRLFDDKIAQSDTIKDVNPSTNLPIPFARIPLKEDLIKQLFLDKFESSEFSSQEAFNDYFRGIILEASGNDGSLLSLDFRGISGALTPSIEIYYTNTVLESGSTVLDTIVKNNSFPLGGLQANLYNMDDRTYPVNNQVKIQGTAGSEGKLKVLDLAKANELRAKNWLINDATLTFYINQSIDTSNIPTRLYLYKNYDLGTSTIKTQIKDAYSEAAFGGIEGFLERDENGKKEKYTFKLTDYISDVINGEINSFPDFKLKVFNSTDLPLSGIDTTLMNYSWVHKAVTIFNNDAVNGAKKPTLTISYSEKK